jgi:hypothetical protein
MAAAAASALFSRFWVTNDPAGKVFQNVQQQQHATIFRFAFSGKNMSEQSAQEREREGGYKNPKKCRVSVAPKPKREEENKTKVSGIVLMTA